MAEPIYYTKMMFVQYVNCEPERPMWVLTIDIPNKEIVFQEYKWIRKPPAIVGREVYEIYPGYYDYDRPFRKPAVKMKNGKTNNESVLIPDEYYEQKIITNYGYKLDDAEIQGLLPYCNALDFEPYRDKEDDWEYVVGYLDEVSRDFQAITNSHIPLIELSCDLDHDRKHKWPTEILYEYIIKKYFENNKKCKRLNGTIE